MNRLLLVSAAALSLSACTTMSAKLPSPMIVNSGVRLPVVADADLACGDQPAVPQRDPATGKRTDSKLQGFILDLRNWGAGCKDKLDAARITWRATEAKQAEADQTVAAITPD